MGISRHWVNFSAPANPATGRRRCWPLVLACGLLAGWQLALPIEARATLTVVPDGRKAPAAAQPAPAVPAVPGAPLAGSSAGPTGSAGAAARGKAAPKEASPRETPLREGAIREPNPVKPRGGESMRAACSDELVALSLGTLGPEDIERLRQKGCLPAAAK